LEYNIIKENNEEFKITTYNDISVIIHLKTGYYNAAKICSDNNKMFKNLNRNTSFQEKMKLIKKFYNIQDELKYELNNIFTNRFSGTYIHPKLVNYVCMWADHIYALKVDQIMDLMNKELYKKNITLEDKIKELECKIKDHCTPINRSIKTHLYIIKSRNGYRFSYKTQPLVNKTNIVKEYQFINADDVKKILIKNIKYLDNVLMYEGKGIYNIFDLNKLDEIINNIKNNIFKVERLSIKDEIKNKLQLLKSSKNQVSINHYSGKLYEYIFAYERNLTLWNNLSQEFLNRYNETLSDHGVDVVDEQRLHFYQLKYYPNRYLSAYHVSSFLKFIDNFSDESAKFFLVCPETTKITNEDIILFNQYNINIIRYDNISLNNVVEERPDDDLISFTKQFYNEHQNKKFPQEELCIEINKKFNTYYKNINHIVRKFYKIYPEYREEKKNISNLIDQYILNNWDKSNIDLSNDIKEKFNIQMNADWIQNKRLTIDKENTKSIKSKKIMNDIEQWIIKEENWYQTDQWKIEKIKELFDVDKSISSIRHITHRKLAKYNQGIKREDGTIYYLTSPYREQSKHSNEINEYIKENWEKDRKILSKEIKEKFNYDITPYAIDSRKGKIRSENDKYKSKKHTQEEYEKIDQYIKDNWHKTAEILLIELKNIFNYSMKIQTIIDRRLKIKDTNQNYRCKQFNNNENEIVSNFIIKNINSDNLFQLIESNLNLKIIPEVIEKKRNKLQKIKIKQELEKQQKLEK
jgi:hypothetical protein